MVSLDQLVEDAKRDFSKASDPAALEDAKARYLGKSGLLTERLKALGGMSPEERKSTGAEINRAKTSIRFCSITSRSRSWIFCATCPSISYTTNTESKSLSVCVN